MWLVVRPDLSVLVVDKLRAIGTPLLWLRIIAAVISAALGLFGLLTDTRTPNGRLTSAGRLALVGIVLSMVAFTVAEFITARNELDTALARSQMQMEQITLLERSLHPLDIAFFAGYEIQFPLRQDGFDNYVRRLRDLKKRSQLNVFRDEDEAFPKAEEEAAVYDAISDPQLFIDLYRLPYEKGREPDATLRAVTDRSTWTPEGPRPEWWTIDDSVSDIRYTGGTSVNLLKSNGRIASWNDLSDCRVVAYLVPTDANFSAKYVIPDHTIDRIWFRSQSSQFLEFKRFRKAWTGTRYVFIYEPR